MKGVVFDTGALIALERGHRETMLTIAEARAGSHPITVPAGCVAQAWRAPRRQARLAMFLRLANVRVVALDDEEARLGGLLLARSKTTDIADAHVVVCAVRLDQAVLTSDPDDLLSLAPGLRLRRV